MICEEPLMFKELHRAGEIQHFILNIVAPTETHERFILTFLLIKYDEATETILQSLGR